jgi:hypothetical protein
MLFLEATFRTEKRTRQARAASPAEPRSDERLETPAAESVDAA